MKYQGESLFDFRLSCIFHSISRLFIISNNLLWWKLFLLIKSIWWGLHQKVVIVIYRKEYRIIEINHRILPTYISFRKNCSKHYRSFVNLRKHSKVLEKCLLLWVAAPLNFSWNEGFVWKAAVEEEMTCKWSGHWPCFLIYLLRRKHDGTIMLHVE